MTWLSISLKNAAACDKWYQLQNHFITESLNANGAWEKPFVGHPRACHTQCRTNKKKKNKERKSFFPALCFFFQNKSPGSGEAGVFVLPARPFGLVFAVSRALFFVRARSLAARLAQPNKTFLKKEKTLRFFLIFKKIKKISTFCLFLFTDLSMAGLPAELKHITQRRKRKQP